MSSSTDRLPREVENTSSEDDYDEDDIVTSDDDDEQQQQQQQQAAASSVPKPPKTWAEWKEEGNAAYKGATYREAVRCYSEAIKADGGDQEPTLFSNRAAAYLMIWEYMSAIADCEQALKLDPTMNKVYVRLAKCYVLSDRLSQAQATLSGPSVPSTDDVRKEAQSVATCISELARCRKLMSEKNLGSAERCTAVLLSLYPDSTTFMMLRCECRLALDPLEQVRVIGKLMARNEEAISSEMLILRAKAHFYTGSSGVQTAIDHLRQALAMDPDCSAAASLLRRIRNIEDLRVKGNNCFKAKDHNGAMENYNAALAALEADNKAFTVVLLCNRAAAWMGMKNFTSALDDCNRAVGLDGSCARAYQRRSRVQQELGKWDEAIRDMTRAVELDDSNEEELDQLKRKAKSAKRKDYYKILGVSRGDSEDVIKKAYRRAALQYHPDKWGHASEDEQKAAEDKFKDIQEAFSVLSDAHKRNLYDNGMLENEMEGGGGGGHPFARGGGFPFSDDVFSSFMGGGMGGGGGHRQRGHPGFSFSFGM
eukprot:PhM_4_TR16014/c0_g1_i1/m.82692/K09527/DNAJC7; DnaJ homolog subfamily C member 7